MLPAHFTQPALRTRIFQTQTGIRQRSLRKHCRLGRATELVFVMALGVAVGMGGSGALADTLNWNGGAGAPATPEGGTGTWDAGATSNWASGGAADSWDDNDDAVFGDANPVGAYTVTIDDTAGAIIATTLTFNTDGVTIDGDALQINTGVTFGAAVGTTTIDSATSGGYQLTTATGAQTLDINGAITGAFTNASAGTVNVDGGGDGVTNSGSGDINITSGVSSLTQSGSGTATVTATVSGATVASDGTVDVQTGGSLGGGATISGDAEIAVTGTGDITGTTTINGNGTLDLDAGTGDAGTVNGAGADFEMSGGVATSLDHNNGTSTLSDGDIDGAITVDGGTVTVSGTFEQTDTGTTGATTRQPIMPNTK